MARTRVAVDVGGTFTDICVLDEDSGAVSVAKVPSTSDPMEGVLTGVEAAPAAMVTTAGFRDVIEIRRGTRDDLWDAYKDVAPPYVRRRDRLEVQERVDYAGRVLEPVDENEARRVAGILARRGISSVAVCFVNSYANPASERRMREILREELPGVSVSTSSEILPEIFEHERFSTAVANAVLSPLVAGYTRRLGETETGRRRATSTPTRPRAKG